MGRPQTIRLPAAVRAAVELALVAYSSTPSAAGFSEAAFRFYRLWLGFSGESAVHGLVQKGIHFVLFFALGTTLFNGLNIVPARRVMLVAVISLAAGIGSESLQLLFPMRNASAADVLLNGSSGALAALLCLRLEPGTGDGGKPHPLIVSRSMEKG